jgi:hypothetical protein
MTPGPTHRYPERCQPNQGANAVENDPFASFIIGIDWCREEDYDAFLTVFEDANDLPRTWQRFAEMAEQAEQFWREQGRVVKRVYINPHTFREWCKVKGCRVDAHARRKFAFEAVNPKADQYG